MRLKIIALFLLAMPALAIAQDQEDRVVADDIVVTAPAPADVPTKGMDKASVTRNFGAPSTRRAPVGGGSRQQPPITRWDYDGYSVFFEYDHVVDTVRRGNPAPIAVRDGLTPGAP